MTSPKLSIIVPIYNTALYLNKCVDSILSQDFTDYELWLIDDGSKDNSIDIIKSYAANDERIRTAFIHGDGPSVPRNYGMRRAKGEYILFVDSDDFLPEGALSIFIGKTQKFPEADYIRGNQRILVNNIREDKSVFAESRSKYADMIQDGETFLVDVLWKDYAPIDALFRTEFLKNNNIEFDEDIVILEDGPFISKLMACNPNCLYINEETYVYRLGTEGSVTNSAKSFKKCISLVRGSRHYKELLPSLSKKGSDHLLQRSVEHCVSSLYQACVNLQSHEAKQILDEVFKTWGKFPTKSLIDNKKDIPHTKKHQLLITLYNINRFLAYGILRGMRSIL